METKNIKITAIVQNKGQVPGLPRNPREWSRDDVEKLARSIEETPDLPLTDWGIPAWEDKEEPEPVAVQEDDFDEDKDHIEVKCKKGDVWELGEHRLMCGDSIDLEQVKTLMGGGVG